MSRLTPESIRASQVELPPIGTVITELRRQDPYIQQEQHRYRAAGLPALGQSSGLCRPDRGRRGCDERAGRSDRVLGRHHLPLGTDRRGPATLPGTGADGGLPPHTLAPPG